MKRRTAQYAGTALLVAVVVFFGVSYADQSRTAAAESGKEAMSCHGAQSGETMRSDAPVAKVQLTEAQAEQLRAMEEVRAGIRVKRAELVALWLEDEPDEENLLAGLRELSDRELKLRELQLGALLSSGSRKPEHLQRLLGPNGDTRMGMRQAGGCGGSGGSGCMGH